MADDCEKQELPQASEQEESKGETPQTVEKAFEDAMAKGGKVFDLDNLEIDSIKKLPAFPDTTEEISFFGNKIVDPKDVNDVLVPLPNLKAFWLNDNPVVENCSNFNCIAEAMPKLEIINSQLTAKAGEWAMLFYAKE